MDVFYYWKDFEADMKAARVGRFRSSKERLAELQAGCPSYIWAFKTPPGRKGELQLLARVVWSDRPPSGFSPSPGETHIYYEPGHPQSVWFEQTDEAGAIAAVTDWVRTNIAVAVASNFQGVNGQHAMRGAEVAALRRLSSRFKHRPFGFGTATAA